MTLFFRLRGRNRWTCLFLGVKLAITSQLELGSLCHTAWWLGESSYTKLTRLVFCLHPHDHGHRHFCLLDGHGNGTHLKSGQLKRAAWEHDIRVASLIRPHKMVCATSSRLDFRAAIIYMDTNTIARQWLSFMRLHWITDDYECTSATASWSWGAHLHTFSSPEQSPVKSSPPAASSMVLTSFLAKSVPIPSNL